MAKNGANGGSRIGAVTGRTQQKNPRTGLWTKRDTSTGKFMSVKRTTGPYKGVRKER